MKNYDGQDVVIKMRVHNLMEVKALIKESFGHGSELQFHGTVWNTHEGQLICVSFIRDVEFELQMPDRSSLTIEVA
jgi:hypothetical protein